MAYKPELWAEAKNKCRLNEEDIRMAKEMGVNPKSLNEIPVILLCDTNHLKGPSKRTAEDDKRFAESLEHLIRNIKSE